MRTSIQHISPDLSTFPFSTLLHRAISWHANLSMRLKHTYAGCKWIRQIKQKSLHKKCAFTRLAVWNGDGKGCCEVVSVGSPWNSMLTGLQASMFTHTHTYCRHTQSIAWDHLIYLIYILLKSLFWDTYLHIFFLTFVKHRKMPFLCVFPNATAQYCTVYDIHLSTFWFFLFWSESYYSYSKHPCYIWLHSLLSQGLGSGGILEVCTDCTFCINTRNYPGRKIWLSV